MVDKSEFEQIARNNMQRLYAHAAVILGSKHDAEDAAEEALYRLFTRRKPFENEEHAKAWLIRVTVNAALKIKRSQKRQCPDSGISEELSADFSYPEQSDVYNAVMKLENKCKTAVMLFYYEDMSVREIAETLRISPSAVTSRLSRGREKLREILKGDYDYD